MRPLRTTTTLSVPPGLSQSSSLFDLLHDLLLIREIQLDIQIILMIHHHRVTFELGAMIHTKSCFTMNSLYRNIQLDPESTELAPDLGRFTLL
jgi:hypothetical protein